MTARSIAFFDKIMNAKTSADVWSVFAETMAGFGFPGLIYAYWKVGEADHIRVAGDMRLAIQQEPPRLAAEIALMKRAPNWFVRWAETHSGVISYREVNAAAESGALTPQEHTTRQQFLDLGLRAGFLVSLRDEGAPVRGLIFLNAPLDAHQHDADTLWEAAGPSILYCCNMAHLRLCSMWPMSSAASVLSARQREVLQWISAGKTSLEVAMILGLKQATVEKHLRLAREALNAQTTAQAVMNAAMRELIFVPPTDDPV